MQNLPNVKPNIFIKLLKNIKCKKQKDSASTKKYVT